MLRASEIIDVLLLEQSLAGSVTPRSGGPKVHVACVCDQIPEEARPCLPCGMVETAKVEGKEERDPWLDAPLTPEEIEVFERVETEQGEPW